MSHLLPHLTSSLLSGEAPSGELFSPFTYSLSFPTLLAFNSVYIIISFIISLITELKLFAGEYEWSFCFYASFNFLSFAWSSLTSFLPQISWWWLKVGNCLRVGEELDCDVAFCMLTKTPGRCLAVVVPSLQCSGSWALSPKADWLCGAEDISFVCFGIFFKICVICAWTKFVLSKQRFYIFQLVLLDFLKFYFKWVLLCIFNIQMMIHILKWLS